MFCSFCGAEVLDGDKFCRNCGAAIDEEGSASGDATNPFALGSQTRSVFDVVASRYGTEVQNASEIALTKLDVLSYLDKIPVITHYLVDGKQVDRFPFPTALAAAEPVIEYLDGWGSDITGIRKWEDLPEAAREYVTYIEKAVGCPITYVSVGAERDSIIIRK